MALSSYRRVFRLPGVTPLVCVSLLARVPVAASGVVLTLHVVLNLGLGYAAAGVVGAATTIGMAVGGPLLGRFVDRRGLRPMLVLTTVAEAAFWVAAAWLPYWWLVGLSFVVGVLTLPVMSVSRQAIAALVPVEQHRTAFSLDSVLTELSFMVGPALGVLIATKMSTVAAVLGTGGAIVLSGIGLYVFNPPIRSSDAPASERVPRSSWLRGPMVAVLIISCAIVLVMSGSEVAVVATLQRTDQISWSGLVIAMWGLASVVGGIVHGAMRKPLSPLVMIGLTGVLTLPVGLVNQWWALCLVLIPSGMMCAPIIASVSDLVTRLSPESARGEAMGVYQSSFTVGAAMGAPLIGAVVDRSTPAWGFVGAGLAGLVAAALALSLGGRHLTGTHLTPTPDPTSLGVPASTTKQA